MSEARPSGRATLARGPSLTVGLRTDETNSNLTVMLSVVGTELASKSRSSRQANHNLTEDFYNEKIVFDRRTDDCAGSCRSGRQRLRAGQFRRHLVAG